MLLAGAFKETFPESLANLIASPSYHYDINREAETATLYRERPAVEELRELRSWRKRGLTGKLYQERLEQELAAIHQMSFDDYFLIVHVCILS